MRANEEGKSTGRSNAWSDRGDFDAKGGENARVGRRETEITLLGNSKKKKKNMAFFTWEKALLKEVLGAGEQPQQLHSGKRSSEGGMRAFRGRDSEYGGNCPSGGNKSQRKMK